ncbi:MAG: helix-turn-helix domain-containing protein [Terriglobia bacterium]|jgi:hypothetical protein
MLEDPFFFTVAQAATLLGLTETEVRSRISSGKLFAGKADGGLSIPRLALLEYASKKLDGDSITRINAATGS